MQLGKEIGKITRELFTGFSMRGRKRIGFTLDVHGWVDGLSGANASRFHYTESPLVS
jgi:hypothetical protein